jgi:DNA-binding XRE family transcriptional regulator
MRNSNPLPIPVKRAFRKLGSDIKTARLRRRITQKLLSERAWISRITLNKIEKGNPNTSIKSYALVLFSLGMIDKLKNLVDPKDDLIGLQLEEENLPKRIRHSKKD